MVYDLALCWLLCIDQVPFSPCHDYFHTVLQICQDCLPLRAFVLPSLCLEWAASRNLLALISSAFYISGQKSLPWRVASWPFRSHSLSLICLIFSWYSLLSRPLLLIYVFTICFPSPVSLPILKPPMIHSTLAPWVQQHLCCGGGYREDMSGIEIAKPFDG